MAKITSSVNVIAPVRPYDSADTYPSFYANDGRGGTHSVSTSADRDNIPSLRREEGMFCYVHNELKTYQLVDGIENEHWTEFKSDGFSLTENYIPKAFQSTIIDSQLYETSSGDVAVGKTTADEKLDVDGAIKASSYVTSAGNAGVTGSVHNIEYENGLIIAASTHTHDDLYYTESEIDSLLSTNSTNDRARANHTGTQVASTITDFTSAARSAVIDGSNGYIPYYDGTSLVDSPLKRIDATTIASYYPHSTDVCGTREYYADLESTDVGVVMHRDDYMTTSDSRVRGRVDVVALGEDFAGARWIYSAAVGMNFREVIELNPFGSTCYSDLTTKEYLYVGDLGELDSSSEYGCSGEFRITSTGTSDLVLNSARNIYASSIRGVEVGVGDGWNIDFLVNSSLEFRITGDRVKAYGPLEGYSINTGYGDFEIGQNLRTTDDVTFAEATVTGDLHLGAGPFTIKNEGGNWWQRIRTEDASEDTTKAFNFEVRKGSGDYTTLAHIQNNGILTCAAINTGHGANELYPMNQGVKTNDNVTFATVNTGHGANELYPMNQAVRTTDDVTFGTLSTTGNTTLGNASSDAHTVNGTAYFVDDVGIGIDDPLAKLHVYGSNERIRVSYGDAYGELGHASGGGGTFLQLLNDSGSVQTTLRSYGDSVLNNTVGNVGIGKNPDEKLDVDGTAKATNFLLTSDNEWIGQDSTTKISFNAGAKWVTIDAQEAQTTGRLVVGDRLTVNGYADIGGAVKFNGHIGPDESTDSYSTLRVYRDDVTDYTIGFKSSQTYGYLNDYAMTFTMSNHSTRGWLWRDTSDAASDGAMSLTTAGELYVKDIVNAASVFSRSNLLCENNIYCGNDIDCDGTAKATNFTTNGSDTFDYEEGTFTGTLSPTDNTLDYTGTCYYTKIGKNVTLHIPSLYTNTDGTYVDQKITGLPSNLRPARVQRCVARIYGNDSSYTSEHEAGILQVNTTGDIYIVPFDGYLHDYYGTRGSTITYSLQ